jgi:hypothetical protein
MIILFIALISVFTCGESRQLSEAAATNPFDGTWQLDRSRDVGSLEELLALAGVNFFARKVIVGLEITEQYTLTSETFRVARRTSHDPGAETVQVYRLGALETVQDAILGGVQSLVRVSEGQTRIQSSLTRPSDHAVFIGTRHVTRENPRLMIYSLNITLVNKQKAGCVRHYVKQ